MWVDNFFPLFNRGEKFVGFGERWNLGHAEERSAHGQDVAKML